MAAQLRHTDRDGAPRPSFRVLLRNRRFMRLWTAQIISNLGDWAYSLAVAITFTATLQGGALVRAMATLLTVEGVTSTVVGLTIAGPIADRYPRARVMVVADVVRCAAVASLLLPNGLAWAHIMVVAAVLGSFRSIFHPAMMSSVPTIVSGEELAVANGVLTATFHLAIMIGPAIGGALVATIGPDGAFVFNAASFGVSALLLIGLRLSGPARERAPAGRFTPIEDLVEGARFLWRSRVARGVTVVMGLSLFLLAMQAAFQPAFVGEVLVPADDLTRRAAVISAMVAMFGAGMVLGSVIGPTLAHRVRPRRLFAIATAVVGIAFATASRQHDIPVVVAAWAVAGLCGGIVNVLYETLLQVNTPDRFRGRVFAAVESVSDGAYVLGAAIVALFWTATTPSTALLRVGVGFGVVSLLTLWLLPKQASVRGEPVDEP
jgi:MFS family permease